MASRKLIDEFSSDEEEEEVFNLPVRFGPQREVMEMWSAQSLQRLLADDNDARAGLLNLVLEFGQDPNPIFIGNHQLPWFEWRARVYYDGLLINRIPLIDAYRVIAGQVPHFAIWFLDGNGLPTNVDGVITIYYGNQLIYTEHFDSTPGMIVTDAADVAFDYLLSIFNSPNDNVPAETISDD